MIYSKDNTTFCEHSNVGTFVEAVEIAETAKSRIEGRNGIS